MEGCWHLSYYADGTITPTVVGHVGNTSKRPFSGASGAWRECMMTLFFLELVELVEEVVEGFHANKHQKGAGCG